MLSQPVYDTKSPNKFGFLVFIVGYVSLLALNLSWFVSSSSPLELESPLKIVMGSFLIFLLPGLVWGEILGFHSKYFLETVALSFALTVSIEVLLIPVPFFFSSGIWLWVLLLFVVSLSGLVVLMFKIKKRGFKLTFLNPLIHLFTSPNIGSLSILTTLLILSFGAYRWGEDYLSAIGAESLLHLVYVRYYYSLPMVLKDIAISPGAYPPNLVHLWEYLIAGWANLINMDPLFLHFRARFVIPVLGLSSMYLLISAIFDNPKKSKIIFWSVLIMVIGELFLLREYRWNDFDGTMAFMGAVHHADSAIAILVALNAALALLTFRNTSWRNISLLTGCLTATFMWHPKEFFIVAIFGGVSGIALWLIPSINKKLAFKNWAKVMATFLAVSLFFFIIILNFVPKHSFGYGYDEFKMKKVALQAAFLPENLLEVRTLCDFPFYCKIILEGNPKNPAEEFTLSKSPLIPWVIISAVAILILAYLGGINDKRLVIFYVLLWFLCLNWNFSMLIINALTYSEIFFDAKRLIYVFAYIIIATTPYVIAQKLQGKRMSWRQLIQLLVLVGILAGGTGILLWLVMQDYIGLSLHFKKIISILLTILVWVSFFYILIRKSPSNSSATHPSFIITTLIMLLFFAPIIGNNFFNSMNRILTGKRPPSDWFGENNIFGFSEKLIRQIKKLPPKRTFLVDPLGTACIMLYAPQYLTAFPQIFSTLYIYEKNRANALSGQHPLFNMPPLPQNGGNVGNITVKDEISYPKTINHKTVREYLNINNVDYIFVNEERYYESLLPYFLNFPKLYKMVFNNPGHNEAIFQYVRN